MPDRALQDEALAGDEVLTRRAPFPLIARRLEAALGQHPAGGRIVAEVARGDGMQARLFESISQQRPGSLGGVAPAPVACQ